MYVHVRCTAPTLLISSFYQSASLRRLLIIGNVKMTYKQRNGAEEKAAGDRRRHSSANIDMNKIFILPCCKIISLVLRRMFGWLIKAISKYSQLHN